MRVLGTAAVIISCNNDQRKGNFGTGTGEARNGWRGGARVATGGITATNTTVRLTNLQQTLSEHRNVRHGNFAGERSQDFKCEILDDISVLSGNLVPRVHAS